MSPANVDADLVGSLWLRPHAETGTWRDAYDAGTVWARDGARWVVVSAVTRGPWRSVSLARAKAPRRSVPLTWREWLRWREQARRIDAGVAS